MDLGRKNTRLGLSLSVPRLLLFLLPCNNLLQPAMEDEASSRRPWLVPPSSPIPSRSIGSSTINDHARYSILRGDPARQLSADQSLSISLFLVLACYPRIPEIRISIAILLLSRDLPFPPFLIREMEISLPRRGKSARHCSRVIAQSCLEIFPFFFVSMQIDNGRVAGNRRMRPGRGPTVAGTTTQYQPPFHRIIYLAADSTPTTSWLGRSAAFVRARPRSALPVAFARRRALTSAHFSPPRAVGRVVSFRSFPLSLRSSLLNCPPSSISCTKFGNVSRATSLNVSEVVRASRNNR